jgi:AMP-binding enzyme
MEETVPAEAAAAAATSPEVAAPGEEVEEQVPVVDVPIVEPEAPIAANPPSSDPSNAEELSSQVPTERSFSFDFDSLQSWVCGAIDPFINGMMTTTPKETPPPPAGFWQPPTPKQNEGDDDNNSTSTDDVPTLRNSDLQVGEDLVRYTSAGESVKTLFQSFEWGVKRNPRAPCLGKRKAAKAHYTWKTYGQIHIEAEKIGIYLKGLGVTQGQRVGFSGKNAPEYLTAIQGCFWAGATTVREARCLSSVHMCVFVCLFRFVKKPLFRSILVSSSCMFLCALR